MEPNVVGQSGTDKPASLLVTRAPATIRTRVTQAVKMAKRCSPGWYGISMPFRIAPAGNDQHSRARHVSQNALVYQRAGPQEAGAMVIYPVGTGSRPESHRFRDPLGNPRTTEPGSQIAELIAEPKHPKKRIREAGGDRWQQEYRRLPE